MTLKAKNYIFNNISTIVVEVVYKSLLYVGIVF